MTMNSSASAELLSETSTEISAEINAEINAEMIASPSSDYARIAEAIRWLEGRYRQQPDLEQLAAHLHLSPFHLQRLFTRWAGISPKRFVQYLTVEHAKELLGNAQSILDVAYGSGLSGPGRLHDLFLNAEAMTPGEFKQGGRGLTIAYGVHPTPFGAALLAETERGICALHFLDNNAHDDDTGAGGKLAEEIYGLRRRWPAAQLVEDSRRTAATTAHLFPLGGLRPAGEVRLLLAGTNFQLKVWEALLRLPLGALCTYEDVAVAIGQPTASRAVGSAVGANEIALLIPCHRVIRKSGVIRDYRWGSVRKQALLGWEAAQQEANVPAESIAA